MLHCTLLRLLRLAAVTLPLSWTALLPPSLWLVWTCVWTTTHCCRLCWSSLWCAGRKKRTTRDWPEPIRYECKCLSWNTVYACFIFPVLRGVNNVRGTSSTLEWTQLPNTWSDCITGYIISWPGGSVIRDDTTTAISATDLNANGFPYCLTITVTVTPNTRVGPLASGAFASVLFKDPGNNCNHFVLLLIVLVYLRACYASGFSSLFPFVWWLIPNHCRLAG